MDYFEKYKDAKIGLLKLLMQFYDATFTEEELKNYGLIYDTDYVFHYYAPEAMYIWNKLNLEKSIYTFDEIWSLEKNVRKEEKKNIDYYREYLELKILNIYMVRRYYKNTMDIKDADKIKMKYDYDLDEYNGEINYCYHCCESAGEHVWNLLSLEEECIAMSRFDNMLKDTRQKILKYDFKNANKIKK